MKNIIKGTFKKADYVIIEKDDGIYLAYIDTTGYRGSINELEEEGNIHGGITYKGDTIPISKDKGNWIGWDYSHYGDYIEANGQIISKYSEEEVEKEIKLVINNMLMDTEKLKKYFKKKLDKESYDFLAELVKIKRYTWGEIKEEVKIEDNKIIWKGNLDIECTKVKKLKAKSIEGYVYADGVESLEDIEIEEEILGYLDIVRTNKDFQLKVKEKVRNGELKVEDEVYYNDF